MISIEAYRASIGRFSGKAKCLSQAKTCQHLKGYNICNASLTNLKTEKGKNYCLLANMLQLFVKNCIVKNEKSLYGMHP